MTGVLGGSVEITWTVTKMNQSDIVSDTRLFLSTKFTKKNLLYEGVAKLSKLSLAKSKFGDRIQANFKEPKYTLTLSNLSYSDVITFTLVVNQEIGNTLKQRPLSIKSVTINEIKGEIFH